MGTEQETASQDAATEDRTDWSEPFATAFDRVVLAAHVPFVCLHLISLYQFRPNYRFFPLWLVAVAWLMWKRWPRGEVEVGRIAGRSLLQFGLGCLAVSLWYLSPSLGATAAVLSLAAVVIRLKGRAAIRALAGVWLLLWFLVPPSLSLGEWLAGRLHLQTARTSSWILESLQVDHFLAGGSFQIPQQDVYAAEACCGVHSHLLFVAIAMLLAVLFRRGFFHGLFLTAAAVSWTFVLHSIRVVIVVANTQSDVSFPGWQHEILGYGLLVLGLLLLLSTDRLLLGLLAPVLVVWSLETQEDPLSRFWNRAVAGPGKLPHDSEFIRRRSRRATSRRATRRWREVLRAVTLRCRSDVQQFWRWLTTPDPKQAVPAQPATADLPRPVKLDRETARWTVSFGCLGALQLVLVLVLQTPRVNSLARSSAFQENWLPRHVASWQATDHHSVQRARCSDDGHFSRSWDYRSDDRAARVSVDFAFLGWHQLARRYVAKGWTEVSRTVTRADAGPFVAVRMSAANGESGYLLYSLFDGATRPLRPGTSQLAATHQRWAHAPLLALLAGQGSAVGLSRGTVQIQQLITDRYPLDEQQRRSADRLYLDLRERLVEQWRTQIGMEGKDR